MAKLKITFDERKFKRELEKQLKKEVNRISGQIDADQMKINDSGEFTMLNKMQEDMLKTILECYDGNESLEVNGSYQVFPKYMKLSIKEAMMQLKSRGLIASFNIFLNGWSIFLTPNGISYFEDKEERERKDMSLFVKLPSNSRQLLQEIVDADNPVELLQEKFNQASSNKEDELLRSLLRELSGYGFIVVQWASNVPYNVQINNSARTYEEKEKEYEKQTSSSSSTIYNDHSINISGGGIVTTGSVINSTLTIDNSVQSINAKIEERGGDDKEELRQLLADTQELIENIKDSRYITKNRNFFSRLSNHLEKHGWFYAEIINLIGTATLMTIGS